MSTVLRALLLRPAAPSMPTSYVVDQLVGVTGVFLVFAAVASRWDLVTAQYLGAMVVLACAFLCFFLMPRFLPLLYTKRRAFIIVAAKAVTVLVLPLPRLKLRLGTPPSGRLTRDAFTAVVGELKSLPRGKVYPGKVHLEALLGWVLLLFAGLRLIGVAFSGLFSLTWGLWLIQQAVVLFATSNFDEDCHSQARSARRRLMGRGRDTHTHTHTHTHTGAIHSTTLACLLLQLLSHPVMAAHISKLHQVMQLLTSLVLPQVGKLLKPPLLRQ